ncbi:MAG: cytidine deaminase [Alphaproteobacteria bacterium]|nr:cytidine deaminase [Alphaproteobacteria bacterium]
MISEDLKEKLIRLAKEAQEKSYAPYSNFPVGAALITEDGDFFTGCNVENISYGLTNCGERTAIFKMISEKGPQAKIKALAVTTKADIPCTPCGACRQVIQEFSLPDLVVIYKGSNDYVVMPMSQHLPGAFTEFVAVNQDGSSKRIQTGT